MPDARTKHPASPGAPGRGRLLSVLSLVLVTALVVGGVFLVQGMPESAPAAAVSADDAAPKVGAAAPDFKAFDIDGNPVTLSDLKGQPVWLLFQATWCSSCRAELPDVEAMSDRVEVVSVYLKEDRDTVSDYAERLGLTIRSTPDPIGEISLKYLTTSVPTHFFIDADGAIASVAKGALSLAEMEEHLAKVGIPTG
ncbi:MAG: redoxin domain-containing protein [Tessaracoccus sp.]|uniref:TlpA family protein disulfide reductase n=1 Tax=Tessaracoccus sp. TaxID=1971211 RepID=UPI001EC66C97|nr:redoxin domain-containing protein [Tessaracoccus sp.]MBK7820669.1 redoxin domain-containing protein [Tessaracoccus sp.]